MGYLQKENNNVIELYNIFSRHRWQTYILAEAATAVIGPGMAAMATPTATVRAIPAPGAAHQARAPAEGHAGGAPHYWDRGGGAGDEGGDRGARGHENRDVYGGTPGISRGNRGGGGGGTGACSSAGASLAASSEEKPPSSS